MAIYLTDWPIYKSITVYRDELTKVIKKLEKLKGVIAIYQVGSISTPGISDIDLWVVFDNGISNQNNPLDNLTNDGAYCFIHHLFGIRKTAFYEAQQYNFFHDYELLSGHELRNEKDTIQTIDITITKQAALEYLIKMYLVMSIERDSGVIKLRNFLLTTKALIHDLEPFGVSKTDSALANSINDVVAIRSRFFDRNYTQEEIINIHSRLFRNLEEVILTAFGKYNLFLPSDKPMTLERGLKITPNDVFRLDKSGIKIPTFIISRYKKAIKIHKRLRKLELNLPQNNHAAIDDVTKRHNFIANEQKYNRDNLPYFISVPFGLNIF